LNLNNLDEAKELVELSIDQAVTDEDIELAIELADQIQKKFERNSNSKEKTLDFVGSLNKFIENKLETKLKFVSDNLNGIIKEQIKYVKIHKVSYDKLDKNLKLELPYIKNKFSELDFNYFGDFSYVNNILQKSKEVNNWDTIYK